MFQSGSKQGSRTSMRYVHGEIGYKELAPGTVGLAKQVCNPQAGSQEDKVMGRRELHGTDMPCFSSVRGVSALLSSQVTNSSLHGFSKIIST